MVHYDQLIGKKVSEYTQSDIDVTQVEFEIKSVIHLQNAAGLVINERYLISYKQADKLLDGTIQPGDIRV